MDMNKLREAASRIWNAETLPALKTFVSRESLSTDFDPEWEKHGILNEVCREAAAWGTRMLPGGTYDVQQEPGRTPALIFSVPGTGLYAGREEDTVFFYGHLDKQPPATGWSEGLGPFTPVVRDGKLYGRGCSDDGYSVYAALTAIRALEDAGIPHPRAVGLIETREESGSNDLEHYLKKNAARFGSPRLVCVLDSGAGNYEQLWLTSSLRGACAIDLNVRVLRQGMHSGTASGVVPSSFDVLRILLDRIQDPRTGAILDPAFNVEIPANRMDDLKKTAEVLGDGFISEFPWAEGPNGSVQSRCRGTEEALIARCWKPTLSVTGAAGLPPLSMAGNSLRSDTTLRLSFRLPPTAKTENILPALQKKLLTDPPFNAVVSIAGGDALPGWNAPSEADWFRSACDESSKALWGKPAMRIGEGGSIPILNLFEAQFPRAQFAVTGVLGPGSNAHNADESLDLAYTEKFIAAVGYLTASIPEEA